MERLSHSFFAQKNKRKKYLYVYSLVFYSYFFVP